MPKTSQNDRPIDRSTPKIEVQKDREREKERSNQTENTKIKCLAIHCDNKLMFVYEGDPKLAIIILFFCCWMES